MKPIPLHHFFLSIEFYSDKRLRSGTNVLSAIVSERRFLRKYDFSHENEQNGLQNGCAESLFHDCSDHCEAVLANLLKHFEVIEHNISFSHF